MEIILRCAIPDRRGALSALTGAVGEGGGDIQAVEVVETESGRVLDDLVVVVDPDGIGALTDSIQRLDEVELVHAGPSRGHPGDAVARLALGIESILNGAMLLDHALQALLGGLLRAEQAEFVPAGDAPRPGDRTIVLAVDERVLALRRPYRFTEAERKRAEAVLRVCLAAGALRPAARYT